MGKGNPVVLLRLDKATLEMIDRICTRSVDHSRDEPFTRSSWIRKAIADKLDHMRRGAGKRAAG